jgi:hypothetical protein
MLNSYPGHQVNMLLAFASWGCYYEESMLLYTGEGILGL